jgi:sterol desaturase/sphingolipid hydroxylase (fatty acid hydroxylase superfamily)
MAAVSLFDSSTWTSLLEPVLKWEILVISFVAIFGHGAMDAPFLEIMFPNWNRIPKQGAHLEKVELVDVAFVTINKFITIPFALQFIQYVFTNPSMLTESSDATLQNVVIPCLLLLLIDDLGYFLFHFALHHRYIYKYIHKHHHRSHAPTRGNWDGLNAHPLEYVCSAYMHLWSLILLNSVFGVPVHSWGAFAFVGIGAMLGALNHSRLDVRIPGLYASAEHDAHHRIPETNFGQYTKVWDLIFGTYVPHSLSSSDKTK